MDTADSKKAKKKGKKGGAKAAGIILLAVVFLAMAGMIIYLLMSRQPEKEEESGLRGTIVTPSNVQDVIEEMDQKTPEESVAAGYYTVRMNYEWYFATGDAVSENAYVENLSVNTNAVYLDLFLEGDEENAIYKSPVIPLGSSLQDIALDTPLEAGTYPCVAVYHLVDDDQKTLSTLRVTVTVVVEE